MLFMLFKFLILPYLLFFILIHQNPLDREKISEKYLNEKSFLNLFGLLYITLHFENNDNTNIE